MLHPSYTDLMKAVNSEVEEGETPVVNSRYSIVLATSKRARQIIAGDTPLVEGSGKKPLSLAIQEMVNGSIRIEPEEEIKDEVSGEEAKIPAEEAEE
ncbi:MAG: DNA-directed RNA polymerase subunit omega [Lachnospiraceae bacterium]|nr:DNA-directed RNA polymerase subunit omega [Lachnospiraceae bacterium]